MEKNLRTTKFAYNSVAVAIQQGIRVIMALIIPRIILKYYGSEINGLTSSILQFISYFSLVEAGLSGASVYALYKPLAYNDVPAISSIVSATKKFYIQAGFVFLGLVLGLSVVYPIFINNASLDRLSTGFLVLILGSSGCLDFFLLGKYQALLIADQKSYIVTIASIFSSTLNDLIIIILANSQINIAALYGIAQISIIIRVLTIFVYCKRQYKDIDYNANPNKKALNKRWSALILQILNVINVTTPVMLITFVIRDLRMVSVFTVCNLPLNGLKDILSIPRNGITSGFGEIIAKGEKKILQDAYKEYETIIYSAIAVVYSVSLLMIQPFVTLYTKNINDANYYQPEFCVLMVIWGLLFSIKMSQDAFINPAGLYKETQWRAMIETVIAVLGGIIMSKFWGMSGIIIGMILSQVYRNIDLLFFVPKYITNLPIISTLKKWLVVALEIGLVLTLCNYLNLPKNMDNFFDWILNAIPITLIALVCIVLLQIIFDRKVFFNAVKRVLYILKIRKTL